jgi:hypothetical protein
MSLGYILGDIKNSSGHPVQNFPTIFRQGVNVHHFSRENIFTAISFTLVVFKL